MGRKKIVIQFIENKKERSVTFCKRKVGLLKKACELGVLCGVDVSLAFSDLNNNIHLFKNNSNIQIQGCKKGHYTKKYAYDVSLVSFASSSAFPGDSNPRLVSLQPDQ